MLDLSSVEAKKEPTALGDKAADFVSNLFEAGRKQGALEERQKIAGLLFKNGEEPEQTLSRVGLYLNRNR